MALKSTLEDTKDRLDALLTYANSITGADDTSVGEAIETLADGYGSGGYSLEDIATGTEPNGAIEINANTLRSYAFAFSNITSLIWNSTDLRGSYAFTNCQELTSVSCPNATTTHSKLFIGCPNLTAVSFPRLQDISNDQFLEETGITTLTLPSFNAIVYRSSFRNNKKLKTVDLNKATKIMATAFNGCTVLDTLILRKSDGICVLENVSAFNNTSFASGGTGGTIYVPSSLIATYQSASNWSTLNGYGTVTWQAIEGSIYENAYADGTPTSN